MIHSTAGFIDAGFDGHITLELANVASLPITLYPGMKIGQVSFMQMTTPADQPYGAGASGSKYQGQRGPTPEPLLRELRSLTSALAVSIRPERVLLVERATPESPTRRSSR